MISRRDLLAALSLLAVAPPGTLAQQPGKVWRVGFLAQGHVDFTDADYIYGPFMQGMRELGYFEGKNLVVTWRSAEGNIERLPELAAELVRLKPDVLTTAATAASLAAQKATATIPIVMISVADPIGTGLAKTLARPGGNSTGLSIMSAELTPKRLELLRGMVPKARRVAYMVNPANAANTLALKNVQAAAQKLGVKMQPLEAGTSEQIANAFAAMAHQNAGALIVPRDPLFIQQNRQIVELAAKQRLPSIGSFGEHAEAGGLMSYGQNSRENFRRAAIYIDKIFKGADPGNLPVEQPTTFELIVNLKTAKALGIKVPQTILIQATKVIE